MTDTRATTIVDLRAMIDRMALGFSESQIARIAIFMWTDQRFPHPLNNTDISDYLASWSDADLYLIAGEEDK